MANIYRPRDFCAESLSMKLPTILCAIFTLAFCASASADLIPLSIRYDANVKRNSDVGVEKNCARTPRRPATCASADSSCSAEKPDSCSWRPRPMRKRTEASSDTISGGRRPRL